MRNKLMLPKVFKEEIRGTEVAVNSCFTCGIRRVSEMYRAEQNWLSVLLGFLKNVCKQVLLA